MSNYNLKPVQAAFAFVYFSEQKFSPFYNPPFFTLAQQHTPSKPHF